jgi:hypothetical protein
MVKKYSGKKRTQPAQPPPPVVPVGYDEENILTAWCTRTWVCIIPEAWAGGFYMVQNMRKGFWDGLGARLPEQQPPWSPKEVREEAMRNNRRVAARSLVLQSRGVLAASVEEAERMLEEAFLETVGNDVLVCTVGVGEVNEEELLQHFQDTFSLPPESLPSGVQEAMPQREDDAPETAEDTSETATAATTSSSTTTAAATKPPPKKCELYNFKNMRIVDTYFAREFPHQIHAIARSSVLN